MDTAVGVIAIAKDLLRTTLATCTAFRTWDGAAYSVAQAKERIYFDALPPPENDGQEYTPDELSTLRPFALIFKPNSDGVRMRYAAVGGGGRRYHSSGTLMVLLQRDVPVADRDDPGQVDRDMENMVGLLLQSGDSGAPGIAELAGNADYLAVTDIREVVTYRGDPDDEPGRGDYQTCILQVDWGVVA